MAAASQKSFAGQGKKKIHGALCTVIFMVLLDRSVPLMAATIHSLPGYTRLTARIGEDVKIPFEFCDKDHEPLCTVEQTFNLSAPNSACTADRHGRCEISVAPGDHPGRQGLETICEICELTVVGVTQKDIGQYSLCRLAGCFWRTITTLEIENDVTQTSSTSASTRPVSTTPTPGLSTTTRNTTEDGSGIRIDPGTTDKPNYAQPGKLSSAVGIPVTVVVIIILIICGVVYLYKKRSRRELAQYQSPALATGSPNTTTVLNINVNNADGCSIEIDGETAHFREDSEFNT